MSNELSNKTRPEVAASPDDQEKNLDSPPSSRPGSPVLFNPFLNTGFFSFRYSYHEMSSSKGKTHVRSREYRYENGKLSSEQFEGTTDGMVYDQAVQNMQNLIAGSMDFFLRSFASMLPRRLPENSDRGEGETD